MNYTIRWKEYEKKEITNYYKMFVRKQLVNPRYLWATIIMDVFSKFYMC